MFFSKKKKEDTFEESMRIIDECNNKIDGYCEQIDSILKDLEQMHDDAIIKSIQKHRELLEKHKKELGLE